MVENLGDFEVFSVTKAFEFSRSKNFYLFVGIAISMEGYFPSFSMYLLSSTIVDLRLLLSPIYLYLLGCSKTKLLLISI